MSKLLLALILSGLAICSFGQNKTIYLVRHSKSSHDNPDLIDFDRPLAKRGHNDARIMAELMLKKNVAPTLFLASPSKRTQETAHYFTKTLTSKNAPFQLDSLIYRCTPTVLIHQLSQLDDKFSSVMVFAHNPATTRAANFFQTDTLIENVPTTGIVAIEFGISEWKKIAKSKGTLKFFEYPKKYRK